MNEELTFTEADLILARMVTEQGATGVMNQVYSLWDCAETDGERLSALVVGLQAYEASLRELQDKAAAWLANRPAQTFSVSMCPTCHKWAVYIGIYDEDGNALRCHGCLKVVGKCTCR